MNDLIRPGGGLSRSEGRQSSGMARLTQDAVVGGAAQLVVEARQRGRSGPFLLVLSAEWREQMGVPAGQRLLDLHSFDYPYGGGDQLTVGGIAGVYFSDKLVGREIGLVDLDTTVIKRLA